MESLEHEQHSSNQSRSARAEVPADQAPTVRCILTLAERDRVPPVNLLEALAARRIEVRECVGVFQTMATLLQCTHQNDSRATAVILIEPAHHSARRAEELLAAIDRFTPGVACWQYNSSATPRLDRWRKPSPAPLVQEGPQPLASKVNGIQEAIRRVEGAPPLRLTLHSSTTPNQPPTQKSPDLDKPLVLDGAEENSKHSSETLLTEAELTMLLDLSEPVDLPAGANGANLKTPTELHPFDSSYEHKDE